MKNLLQAIAVGASLSLVQAGGSFKWNVNQARDAHEYVPASETGVGYHIQTPAMGPAPTSPPQLMRGRSGLLPERQNADGQSGSVCGYIEGSSASPYSCAVTDSCKFTRESGTRVGGCCASTSLDCPIATTCIDSTVWDTLLSIGDQTYGCTSSEYPYCMTMTYEDVVGYSIMACAMEPQTADGLILHKLATATSPGASTAKTTIPVDTAVESSGDVSNTAASGDISSSSTSTATSTAAAAGRSSLPIGAIVGGAVGGIAIIALLVLGLVLILRKRRPKTPPAMQGVQAGGPPPSGEYNLNNQSPPPMEQQWQQQQQQQPPPPPPHPTSSPPPFQPTGVVGGGLVDNRISMQKAPFDIKTHEVSHSVYDAAVPSSPGGSPLQQHHSPSPNYVQPVESNGFPLDGQPPQQGHGVSPTESGFQQYQQQHDISSYAELPVARADGQLREMP